jgi:hypothetical protein
MQYREKMVDRQIGRNAELFAEAVGVLKTPEERYPYLRILISIIELARPEWNQSPNKDRQMAHLILKMSRGQVPMDESAEVCRLRDMERGFLPLPEAPDSEGDDSSEASGESGESETKKEPAKAEDAAASANAKATGEDDKKDEVEARKPERKRARRTTRRPREEAIASSDVPTELGDDAGPADAAPETGDLFGSDKKSDEKNDA